ncbi:transcriptional regulator with XRE-family HTH domain [Streptacidiphilus sp. EB129]
MMRCNLWDSWAAGGARYRTDHAATGRAERRTAPEPGVVPGQAAAVVACAVSAMELTQAERELGLALYRLRMERGLSLRALAKLLGYSAHSGFADVEKARRLPSESLVRSYEECFAVPPNSLLALRQEALRARAVLLTDRFAAGSSGVLPPVAGSNLLPAAPEAAPCLAGYRYGRVAHFVVVHLVGAVRCLVRGRCTATRREAVFRTADELAVLSAWRPLVAWRGGGGLRLRRPR